MASIESPNPLSKFPVLESTDIEEARDLISRNFAPHTLNIVSNRENLTAQYHGVSFDNMTLACSNFGTGVLLKPESENFFYTQTTLSGNSEVKLGNQFSQTQKGSTVVVSPSANYELRLHEGNSRLIAMFERDTLEHHLSQLLNQHLKEPLIFDLSMNSNDSHSDNWVRSLTYLCDQLSFTDELTGQELYLKNAHQMLMSLLLEIQPHNYSDLLHQDPVVKSPRHVKRAISFIEENIDQPISIVELASTAGVTTRALQKGFTRYTGSTPSEYIRSLRVLKIHESLLSANSNEKVSDILTKFNITHFSRFALSYKEVYGCTPSETLKKR